MRHFLNVCAEIEETVGQIYDLLAEKAVGDERLLAIWRQMARDERDHAGQIRFALRLPGRHVFEEQDPPEVKVEQLLSRARTILQGVKSSSLSDKEALRIALKLEGDFLVAHIACAKFKDESIKKMLQCLARADEVHLALLRSYAENVFGKAALDLLVP